MEEVDTNSVAVAGIDISNVDPVDQRRLTCFINHFLISTVSFLNQFWIECEERLERMHYQLDSIETKLAVLNCKLGPQENTVPDTVKDLVEQTIPIS